MFRGVAGKILRQFSLVRRGEESDCACRCALLWDTQGLAISLIGPVDRLDIFRYLTFHERLDFLKGLRCGRDQVNLLELHLALKAPLPRLLFIGCHPGGCDVRTVKELILDVKEVKDAPRAHAVVLVLHGHGGSEETPSDAFLFGARRAMKDVPCGAVEERARRIC